MEAHNFSEKHVLRLRPLGVSWTHREYDACATEWSRARDVLAGEDGWSGLLAQDSEADKGEPLEVVGVAVDDPTERACRGRPGERKPPVNINRGIPPVGSVLHEPIEQDGESVGADGTNGAHGVVALLRLESGVGCGWGLEVDAEPLSQRFAVVGGLVLHGCGAGTL